MFRCVFGLCAVEQERARGKTQEVGRACFETKLKRYTILDAPGEKDFFLKKFAFSFVDICVFVV